MAKDTEEVELKTQMSEAARYGEYANFVKIQHSGIDFRFDFAKIVPEENTLYVHTRLFMSPIHAKLFMKALEDNIEKYEKTFGVIQLKIEKGVPITGLPSKEMH
jgi:hypothetical protein